MKKLFNEIYFKTSRSSGKGGQHVNKVETKVELFFDVANSKLLTYEQKDIIFKALHHRITGNGILHISVQSERSQFLNKQKAVALFEKLVTGCFLPHKKRIPTKPSTSAKEKRINKKRKHSEKKKLRRKVSDILI